jgi:hypothetical protein
MAGTGMAGLLADGFSILVLVVLLLALVLLFKGVRAVPQGSEYTVERFGRYTRTLKPGLNLIVPFVERIGARTDELDKSFVRDGRSGGRVPERPPRVWRRHAPTWSRWSSTTQRSAPTRPKPARPSGLHGAMLLRHGRPRGEQRGRGWKPRRAA